MTTEEVKQAEFLLEAPWRETLPPVLRPIAERYGKRFFMLAYNIGAVNEALAVVNKRTVSNNELQHCVKFIAHGLNVMASLSMEAAGMDRTKLAEIQLDIVRASELAGASKVQGGRIIVPS